jgi:Ca-activated chloride channel family protein
LGAGRLPAGLLLLAAAVALAVPVSTAVAAAAPAGEGGGLVMARDSSGSTAAPGGSGRSRIASARAADAPDAAAPARRLLQASAQRNADAYRLQGDPVAGGATAARAAPIRPGQYLDTIGPGETRWYAATLDAGSAADLSATAAPRPGVPVDYGDGIELTLTTAGAYAATCDTQSAHFGQDEGAMTLTGAVGRTPDQDHHGMCDRAGRYLLSVHRTSAAASDQARWPVEMAFGTEPPLPAGTVPAAARTDYGTAPAPLTGTPRDLTGGTGFNDATAVGTGVYRDRLLPAQTRYYAVHVGWGQQLSYVAEFANEPVTDAGGSPLSTFVATSAYAPGRLPVEDASDARTERSYDGSPVSVGLGTVPVSWTNRWVDGGAARAVHRAGDYWIAVGLGPEEARPARDAAVGVVLRVQVTGDELAGPQYHAPVLARQRADGAGPRTSGGDPAAGRAEGGGTQAAGGSGGSGGSGGLGDVGGITGTDMIAAGAGGAVALAGVGVAALVHRTRGRTERGGA